MKELMSSKLYSTGSCRGMCRDDNRLVRIDGRVFRDDDRVSGSLDKDSLEKVLA